VRAWIAFTLATAAACSTGEGGASPDGNDRDVVSASLPSATIGPTGELELAITENHTQGSDVPSLVCVGSDGTLAWHALALGDDRDLGPISIETIDDRALLVWNDTIDGTGHAAFVDAAGDGITGALALPIAAGEATIHRVGDRYLVLANPGDAAAMSGLWLRADGTVDGPLAIDRAAGDFPAQIGDDPDGTVGEIPLVFGSLDDMRVARVTAAGDVLPDVVAATSAGLVGFPTAVELADHTVVASYLDDGGSHVVVLPPDAPSRPAVVPAPTPSGTPSLFAMVAIRGATAIAAIADAVIAAPPADVSAPR
jgi:hypothetical protein